VTIEQTWAVGESPRLSSRRRRFSNTIKPTTWRHTSDSHILETVCFVIPYFPIVLGGDSRSVLIVDRDSPGSDLTLDSFLFFRLNSV